MHTAIPADLCLENPPPDFIGRAAEVAHLKAALKTAPCVEICGPPGIGKSSLVRHFLASRRAKQAPIRIELLDDISAHECIVDGLRRASRQTEGRTPSGSIQTWYVTALELAEADRRWVVIEDFHLAPESERQTCLTLIANHARRSRWIFVGWRPTPCEAAVLRIPLAGLPRDVLNQLLTRRLQASPTLIESALLRSGGSPRAALQHASGMGADPWMVPEMERTAAERLALSQVALPLCHLESTPQTLIDRGLVAGGPGGVRAHSAARAAWSARWPTALATQRMTLAGLLIEDASPILQLEGVRLLSVAGALPQLSAALDRLGEAILDAGFAWGLWQCVRGLNGIDRWRLRIAAELGTAEALAWLPEDPPNTLEDRHWWARCWFLRGAFARALPVARPLAEEWPAAGLTAALCLMNLGQFEAAERLLAERPDDRRWAIRRSACLARMDRASEARALALEVHQTVLQSSVALGPNDTFALARTFLDLEAFTTAATLLDDLPAGQVGGGPTAVRLAQFHVAEYQGDFERIARLNVDLQAHTGSVLIGTSIELAHLRASLSLGSLTDFTVRLDRVTRSIRAAGLPASFHLTPASDFGRLRAHPPTCGSDALDAVSGPVFARWAARHGQALTQQWNKSATQRVLTALARTECSLAQGDRVDEIPALAMARSLGLGGIEVDALSVACDATIVGADWAGLAASTAALAQVSVGSQRYQTLVAFYRWVANPADFGPLEALAGQADVAPMPARRAQALLGETVRLDGVDRRVLANLPRAQRLIAGDGPGWGIDRVRAVVWRCGKPAVSLARRPVAWRLLCALSDAGGTATKEALVEAIWAEPYHPLRHDNRLQVAVRAVRMTIEDDAHHPVRLITCSDGYALGGPCGLHENHPM